MWCESVPRVTIRSVLWDHDQLITNTSIYSHTFHAHFYLRNKNVQACPPGFLHNTAPLQLHTSRHYVKEILKSRRYAIKRMRCAMCVSGELLRGLRPQSFFFFYVGYLCTKWFRSVDAMRTKRAAIPRPKRRKRIWPKTAIFHYEKWTNMCVHTTCRQLYYIFKCKRNYFSLNHVLFAHGRTSTFRDTFRISIDQSVWSARGMDKGEASWRQLGSLVRLSNALVVSGQKKWFFSGVAMSVQRVQTEADLQFSTRTIWFISICRAHASSFSHKAALCWTPHSRFRSTFFSDPGAHTSTAGNRISTQEREKCSDKLFVFYHFIRCYLLGAAEAPAHSSRV